MKSSYTSELAFQAMVLCTSQDTTLLGDGGLRLQALIAASLMHARRSL